jgi:hypothetical protein
VSITTWIEQESLPGGLRSFAHTWYGPIRVTAALNLHRLQSLPSRNFVELKFLQQNLCKEGTLFNQRQKYFPE